ncbi:MAG: hypothetical protein LBE75_01935 [Burkholderiales bacterium]|nr:hypothetical protein [Burkholderiales bacterium]
MKKQSTAKNAKSTKSLSPLHSLRLIPFCSATGTADYASFHGCHRAPPEKKLLLCCGTIEKTINRKKHKIFEFSALFAVNPVFVLLFL